MSIDYQSLDFRNTTPVTRVDLFDTSPLTLDIAGNRFVDVVAVQINGLNSPEYIVLSPRRILAQVPRSQRLSPIESVSVITASNVSARRSVVSFLAIPPRAQSATGLTKLVQTFLKVLFTTPGQDIFLPQLGGGLLDLVGSATSPSNLKAASKIAITTTQSQLVRIQSQSPRLTREERLKSATLLSSDFRPREGTLDLRVRVRSVAGDSADAGVIV